MKEQIFVSGHKNPDTDTICSALAYANFKNKQSGGCNYLPIRLGNVSNETGYALDYFKVDAPVLVESIEPGQRLIQVDHNESIQSVTGIESAELLEIIDHHRVNGVFTTGPLLIRMEPVGCTATIITKMFREENIEIDGQIAGLMMSAIISDSLLFKSPTCTALDEATCRELAAIAGVPDVEAYGLEMLKAGTSLKGKSIEAIFKTDFKDFEVAGLKFGVAQVNTMDIEGFLGEMKADMLTYMNELVSTGSYQFLLLALTDIIKEGSQFIVAGDTAPVVQAYKITLADQTAYVPGVLSRKKQIIPVLTEVLTGK